MSDWTVWFGFWCLLAICILTGISALWHYHISKPTINESVIELVEKYDIHPTIARCTLINWDLVPEYAMCREIFEKYNLDVDSFKNK